MCVYACLCQYYVYKIYNLSAFVVNYCIRGIIGRVFNLVVWRIIFNPPNLNNAISGL